MSKKPADWIDTHDSKWIKEFGSRQTAKLREMDHAAALAEKQRREQDARLS